MKPIFLMKNEKLGVMPHVYNPSAWTSEAEGLPQIQGQCSIQSKRERERSDDWKGVMTAGEATRKVMLQEPMGRKLRT